MQEEKAKILLVDDVPENLVALSAVLASLSIETVKASSGREALKCLLEDDFAVVLLDVQMPDMDGFETAAMIRGRDRSRHTPIIFVTAMYTTQNHATLGYNMGAVDYIFKPVIPDVLRAKVSVFVDLYRKNAEINRQSDLIREIHQQELEEKLRSKELERMLLMQRTDKLQESDRLKSEFLANMSHEIRTPMNGVVGMAELMLTTNLNPEQREMATVIRESGQALLAVINDILDLSKIEAGKMQVNMEDFDLKALIDRTSEMLIDSALVKGVSFDRQVGQDVPRFVRGDPSRVRQILVNLLSNSIKFTDQGSVTLDVRVCGIPDANGSESCRVQFMVTDTGIGISKDRLPAMFMPFTQEDSSTTRKYGGTGLGLSISKRLCDLMGGSIQIHEAEIGSCFSFELPFKLAQSTSNVAYSVPPMFPTEVREKDGKPQILLAEDSPTNQRVTLLQLKRLGLTIQIANNGAEAVRACAERNFGLILMDCQMPEMDGFEATRAIRRGELRSGIHTPIIGLTAQAMAGDRQRCLEAGMDDYISKPASLERFQSVVQKWLLQPDHADSRAS